MFQNSVLTTNNFQNFLVSLDKGEISKVVFKGIRPESCTAYFKDGHSEVIIDGFPSYDDPRSPSGPLQGNIFFHVCPNFNPVLQYIYLFLLAIAKVQHTPGVVCEQDVSEVLRLASKAKKASSAYTVRPMMSHSAYPSELMSK